MRCAPCGQGDVNPLFKPQKRPRPYGQGRKSYAVPPWFRQPLPDGAQRPGGPRPVTGPAVPPYYVRSGGRLREQSSAKVPHRLAAAAGSLKAGHFAFLPINVVNGFILCGFSHFVKEKSAQTSQRSRNLTNIRSAYIFSGITAPSEAYQVTSFVMFSSYHVLKSASLTSIPFNWQRSTTFSPSASPQNRPSWKDS